MSDRTLITTLSQVALAAQLGLGFVFLLSALPKLRRPLAFARRVVAYEILPAGAARAVALVMIPLESFLAVAFLTGWEINVALPLAAAALLTFLAAVGIDLLRGKRVSCGCFGEESEPISPRAAVRLLLLLAVVLLLVAFRGIAGMARPNLGALTTDGAARASLLEAATLAGFLLLAGAWLLRLPELVSLVRQLRRSRPVHGGSSGGDGVEGA